MRKFEIFQSFWLKFLSNVFVTKSFFVAFGRSSKTFQDSCSNVSFIKFNSIWADAGAPDDRQKRLQYVWSCECLFQLSQCRSSLLLHVVWSSYQAQNFKMVGMIFPIILNQVGKGWRLDDNGPFPPQRTCWHLAEHRNVKMILVLMIWSLTTCLTSSTTKSIELLNCWRTIRNTRLLTSPMTYVANSYLDTIVW